MTTIVVTRIRQGYWQATCGDKNYTGATAAEAVFNLIAVGGVDDLNVNVRADVMDEPQPPIIYQGGGGGRVWWNRKG